MWGGPHQRRGGAQLLAAFACAGVAVAACAVDTSAAAAATKTAAVSGKIAKIGNYQFTLQVAGTGVGVVGDLTAAANKIAGQDWPYVWGGGHALAGVASTGEKGGPGYNGKRKGFDCSGSVAAVLVAGGLWPLDTSVPSDSGVISELKQDGLISKGAASGPGTVTLYDWPGHHIFMNIDGRFWGTSDGSSNANSKGGPGWLTGYPYNAISKDYKAYHFFASKLNVTSIAGETLGFTYPQTGTAVLGSYKAGSSVKVTYKQGGHSVMVATAVAKAKTPSAAVGNGTPTGGGGL
jgi:hypothetical protein